MSGLLLLRRPSHVRCLSSRLSQVRQYALIGKPRAKDEPRWALPTTPARTRFAPSPTGYLHLGSLRTALYNYLLAKATGGQFVIRLEDTDQARLVNDAEQVLYDDLRWAGLHWDEGPDKGGPFGPYKQSERLGLYVQHANSLLESGHAFRCFCTKQDLDFNIQQATSSGAAAHYPGTCTHIEKGESDRRAANGEPHVVRFKAAKMPVPALDLVYGTYKKAEQEDSFIIMKSDGFPTYHFANVVDDHFMEITHVIRGAEWLISTPKHVELYNAFGWQPPNFAHVGLLVDGQRQKLSKRDMASIGIGVYRTNYIVPEALLNFSALLGWDPNLQKNTHLDKRGIMTLEDMKQNFTLKFTRGDIVVDLSKLKFFQSKITRKLVTGENPDSVTLSKQIIQPILAELNQLDKRLQEYRQNKTSVETHLHEFYDSIGAPVGEQRLTEEYVLEVLRAWKGTVNNPFHFIQDNIFAFYRPSKRALRKEFRELQSKLARIMILKSDRQKLLNSDVSVVLKKFTARLKPLTEADWNAEKLGHKVKTLTDSVKFYDTADDQDKFDSAGWKLMRYALVNGQGGPAIVPLMLLWGQDETIHRVRDARKVAAAEEIKIRTAGDETRRQETAMKVRIRQAGGGPLGAVAKQEAIGRKSNLVIEPRNVKIWIPPKLETKTPTPPKEEPFNIYLHKEKGRGEVGPFKSRPQTPRSLPRSPPRDPSEVEHSPQFLSFSEFKFGTRHLKLPKKPEGYGPAFWELEELQRQPRPQHQDLQTPFAVQPDAVIKSMEGQWVVPRSLSPRSKDGQPEARRSSVAGEPLEVDRHDPVKLIMEPNKSTYGKRAKTPRSGAKRMGPSAGRGPADTGPLMKETPHDMQSRGSKASPFKLGIHSEFPVDKARHVEHLRALNRSLADRKAAARRSPSRGGETSATFGRLEELKAMGPSAMSRSSGIKDMPRDDASSGSRADSDHAYGRGEQATALAPNYGGLATRNRIDRLSDRWGTSLDLDYQGKREAAADWNAKKEARLENEKSVAQIEQQMAMRWADRNK